MFFVLRSDNLDKMEQEEEEIFITACDLTAVPTKTTQLKGCVIRSIELVEEGDEIEQRPKRDNFWRKYVCCQSCFGKVNDSLWMLAVRCTKASPRFCNRTGVCSVIDGVCMIQ